MTTVLTGIAVFIGLAFLAAIAAYVDRIAKAQERRATVEEKRLARDIARDVELFGPIKDER